MEEGFKGRGKFHSSCTPSSKPPKQKRHSAPPNLWGEYERAEQNNKIPKNFPYLFRLFNGARAKDLRKK